MKTTSLKLSQRLKALNVPQLSEFWWTPETENSSKYECLSRHFIRRSYPVNMYSSYSSDELGEWLPFSFKRGEKDCTWEFYKDTKGGWECWINEHDGRGHSYTYAKQRADTLAEAMGLMMEYLIMNGYIKVEELK